MALKRDVGFFSGLGYRGGGPMWAWILHRISGLAMVIFVSTHVVAGFLTQQTSSDAGVFLNTIFESLYFQIFIVFCVIFHTLNGARIIILDVWPKMIEYQREVTWLQWLIFLPVYGLTIFIMITRTFAAK